MRRSTLASVSLIAVMAASSVAAETISDRVLESLTESGLTHGEVTREGDGIRVAKPVLGTDDGRIEAPSMVITDDGLRAEITVPEGASFFSGTERIDLGRNDLVISTNGFPSGEGEMTLEASEIGGATFAESPAPDAGAPADPRKTSDFTLSDLSASLSGVFGDGEKGVDMDGDYRIGSVSFVSDDDQSSAKVDIDAVTGVIEAVISPEIMKARDSATPPEDLSGLTVLARMDTEETRVVVGSVPGLPVSEVAVVSMTSQAEIALRDGKFSYRIGSTGAQGSMSRDGQEPVSFSVGPVTADFSFPMQDMSKSPFSMGYAIEDVTISESGWALLDPSGAIPRTPASFVLRLSGVISDEFTGTGFAGGPASIESAKLEDFRLSFGGAEMTAQGDVSMAADGSGPESGGGRITLTGVETLLAALGKVVPAEALNGARMGMAMMFVKDGEDKLVSETEIRNGEVYVNGQRFR